MAYGFESSTVSTFSPNDRSRILARMGSEKAGDEFDLVVIGGGITGAGVARDAASRGMKVALVEMRDFSQGTSSRSSKLIHGGIRYLENFEFGLVFEALSERRLLFEIAPHLVHPLRFVIPLYKSGRVGMFKMGLGMWAYDALSMFEAPELHERLSAKESVERLPLLQKNELLGSYVYSDAYMDDDRLTIETLRSAVKQGALCLNYVSADNAERDEQGQVRAIHCTDQLTGKKLKIRGRHFVGTLGPWTDSVAPKLVGDWRKILRPTKGIHLTFDRKRLPLHQAVVMGAEKRIVFGIPRHEMIIIGTTDTDFSGDPNDVGTTPDDVNYVLGVAEKYFPGAKLTSDDIIASYAGVRPLVDDGSSSESKTSREHLIVKDPHNVTFIAGGKYTTYRRMAEDVVKAALDSFPIEDRVRFGRNDTKRPLNDEATQSKIADTFRDAQRLVNSYGLSPESTHFLIERHGGEAKRILQEGARAVGQNDEERLWALEVHQAIHQTMCLNLVDFYVRRSPLFLARRDHGQSLIGFIGEAFAAELGWSDSKRQEEISSLQAFIRHELNWKQSFGIKPSSF
jgi:glycerol-3-phosphate dehydrogenase